MAKFKLEIEEEISKLSHVGKTNNSAQLHNILHKINGSSKYIGATELEVISGSFLKKIEQDNMHMDSNMEYIVRTAYSKSINKINESLERYRVIVQNYKHEEDLKESLEKSDIIDYLKEIQQLI